MLKRIRAMARDATIAIGITAILFVLVNFAAAYALKRERFPPPDPMWNAVHGNFSPEGRAILRAVFAGESDQEIRSRFVNIPFTLHPILEYAAPPIRVPRYHIGIENVRYHDNWNDDEVKRRLGSDRLTVILGGSTTFGSGVANNETWPYFFDSALHQHGEDSLNFGTIAYDQQREIDRLVYHLRQGLRPKRVIFLDGLNDLLVLFDSNLRPGDRIVQQGFVASRGEVAISGGLQVGQRNWWRLLAEALPAVQWIERKLEPDPSAEQIIYSRDVFTQGFDFREAEWARFFWYKWAPQHAVELRAELIAQYKTNLGFIGALAKSFGFEALVFYQPIGLFDPADEFVTDVTRRTPEYAFLASLDDAVHAEIRAGRLGMIDLHDTLAPLEHLRYVDVSHYSPAAHRLIAAAIFAHVKPLSP
jgi:hypothetical protein